MILEIIWQNFLGRFEGSNRSFKIASSALLQGLAQIFVEEFSTSFGQLIFIHLGLVVALSKPK